MAHAKLRIASAGLTPASTAASLAALPPVVIQHAVWLYFRFPLNCRDVEDLLAERGIDVSYETVRRWALKFGQAYARRLQDSAPSTRRPVAP